MINGKNIDYQVKTSEILKEREIRVNSNHRYHITKVNNFTVSAYSELDNNFSAVVFLLLR